MVVLANLMLRQKLKWIEFCVEGRRRAMPQEIGLIMTILLSTKPRRTELRCQRHQSKVKCVASTTRTCTFMYILNWISKLNKILVSFTTIQQRQLVRLRNRVFRWWLCIVWNHQRPTTCKISYNSEIIFLTVESDISPRPNKPDSPNRSVCATSTRLRTNFNHIIFFMLWLFRMWDNTLRTLSDGYIR